MADSGEGRSPRDDEDDYAHGSEVPPPPSYDKAVGLKLSSTSGRVRQQRGPRPLSQIDKYTTSWLFPLMMRVKTTLQGVRKQLKKMEEDTGELGQKVLALNNKSYLGLVKLTGTGAESFHEGDMLSSQVKMLLKHDPGFKERYNTFARMKYADMKVALREDLMKLRFWLMDQLQLDKDWEENTPRIPAISNFEVLELKNSMMKVDSHRSAMEAYRCSNPELINLVDYGIDMLLKMDMENLWSFLVRIGDYELAQEDGGVSSGQEWGPDWEEEDWEEQADNDNRGKNDAPKGEEDRLRQKRLQKYDAGRPPRAARAKSQEEEEQEDAMLPKYGARPERRRTSRDRGDSLAGADSGDDNEAERRALAYSQDEEDNCREEIEMAPAVRIVSQEDVELETDSLPRSGSPDSYRAAISYGGHRLDVDRYSPRHSNIDETEPGPTVQQFEIEEPDAESGRRRRGRRRSSSLYDVGSMPIPLLRELINLVVRKIQYTKNHWSEYSLQKRLILVFSVLFVVGLVLLVFLLPSSFVYIDYHEMGFVYNRATARTDIDRVYEYGCYLLAPQHSMVLFPATAHFLDLKLSVMNKAGLSIGLEVYLQYLLRPNELSQLYRRYNRDYERIIENIAESTVKNMAIEFTLDEYKLNRSMVESSLFHRLKRVLSGDCCNLDNDRYKRFQVSAHHSDKPTLDCNADAATCDPGFHIDLAFFQMGSISIPEQVMNHYLKQIVLVLETERELYIQDKAVEVKKTSLSVQNITNQADEIRAKARAESLKIRMVSEASRLKMKEQSYVQSLKKTFDMLKITEEEEKASLLFLNTLKHIKDNLVAFSYNYDQETLMSP